MTTLKTFAKRCADSFEYRSGLLIKKLDQLSPYPIFYSILMTKKEIEIFDQNIKNSKCYLEFGLGGSTIRAIQKSKAKIFSVESSPIWINIVRQYFFIRRHEKNRLQIISVDIGPVEKWGFPQSGNSKELFKNYSSSIFEKIDGSQIDLALVDGRFRMACILKIIKTCHNNKDFKIMIHDFWGRPEYHIALKYLDTISQADSLGVFTIKKNIDLKLVDQDYEIYKNNPE